MKYDLLIFDCDGTLVDSETLLNKALSRVLNDLGFPMYTEEFCIEQFTGTAAGYVNGYLKEKHPEMPLQELEEKFLEVASHLVPLELKPMPGAIEVLDVLKDAPKCVVSNGFNGIVRYSLEVTGIKKHFTDDVIFTFDVVGSSKPDPDMFFHAAKHFGVAPDKCLVIEDSVVGIQAAIAAEMDLLVIYPHENLPVKEVAGKARNKGFIKDLREIVSYI